MEELESGAYQPGWNQFDLNKQKFGVQSTWDEARHPPAAAATSPPSLPVQL